MCFLHGLGKDQTIEGRMVCRTHGEQVGISKDSGNPSKSIRGQQMAKAAAANALKCLQEKNVQLVEEVRCLQHKVGAVLENKANHCEPNP